MKRRTAVVLAFAVAVIAFSGVRAEEAVSPSCAVTEPYCYASFHTAKLETIRIVQQPPIAVPVWFTTSGVNQ